MINLDTYNKLKNWKHSFPKGHRLTEQDKNAIAMYILMDGKVDIQVDNTSVGYIEEAGSYIGELSFLLNRPAAATCIVLEPVQVIQIGPDLVEKFMHSSADVVLQLAKKMASRIAELDKDLYKIRKNLEPKTPIVKGDIFAQRSESREWIQSAEDFDKDEIHLEDGEILLSEGTASQYLFILKKGKLNVVKKNQEINEITKTGDMIGEVALLLDQIHLASCIAAGPTDVIRIRKDELQQRIENNPKFGKLMLMNIALRLVDLGKKLGDYRAM